jgi:N-acetylglucosaminyldiphosphoundecaprenol N-acetyl-beta-D-mannosaminyltransferase
MVAIADNTITRRSAVGTIRFNALTRWEAATHVRDELVRGRGGRIVVVSAEQLRQLRHVDHAPELRMALDDADLVLAGSATAVWASRLAGTSLPERIHGPALADALCAAGHADRRRVYLVGGAAATAGLPGAAVRAAAILGVRHLGLRVCGGTTPTADIARDGVALDAVMADLVEAKPDLVLVGVESGADEQALVAAVRSQLAGSWIFACGGLVRDLAGDPGRGREPGVPVSYAARLLTGAVARRVPRRRPRNAQN